MEFEPALVAWKSRGPQDKVIDVSTVNHKDGSKSVVITTRDEVIEYCPHTRKYLNHWTFRSGSHTSLALGAVRHPSSPLFYGIRSAPTKNSREKGKGKGKSSDSLVAWRTSEVDASKWKHTPLRHKKPVLGIYVHPQLPAQCVVVFQSGEFAVYNDALHAKATIQDVDFQEGEGEGEGESAASGVQGETLFASLTASHRNPLKGALLLSLIVKSPTNSSCWFLVVYELQAKKDPREDMRIVLLSRHELPREIATSNQSIATCAFHSDSFSFSIVGNTGTWHILTFQYDPVQHHLVFQSQKAMPSFHSTASSTSGPAPKKRRLELAASASASASVSVSAETSSSYIASGVGNFSYLVAAQASAPRTVQGWDARFGVQIASTELDPEKKNVAATSMSSLQSLRVSQHGDLLLSVYDGCVVFQHLKNKHSTLASVLGATTKNESTAAPAQPTPALKWPAVTDPALPQAWKQAMETTPSRDERTLIEALSDPKMTPTAGAFQEKLDVALAACQHDASCLSHRVLLAVTRRCVASPELQLWAPLQQMLATRRLSARVVPSLLPVLMQEHQFELLDVALQHLVDIDERSIVRLLRYFIHKQEHPAVAAYVQTCLESSSSSASPGSSKTKTKTKTKRKKASGQAAAPTLLPANVTPGERFVLALLMLPTNTVFLHHAIRAFTMNEVLFLLTLCKKYLVVLTSTDAAAAAATESSFAALQALVTGASSAGRGFLILDTPLTALHCTQWLCALLDTHFTQLVLAASQETRTAASLHQLEALVHTQLTCTAQFERVQSVLGNFLAGINLPQAHGIPDYSIEELRL